MGNRVTAEEARGLLEAATPGPWSSRVAGMSDRVLAEPDEDGYTIVCAQPGGRRGAWGYNAALIAAAPDLAATVVALEADLAALRIEHEAHAVLLSLARRDRDEARARIAVLEEEQRRDIADVEHFRTMARGYMDERDEARATVSACMGAIPVTTVAFDGNVPLYIRSCFDAHDATMQRSIDGAAERIAELVAERDEARAERDRLRDILASLVDDEPCWYDHHGGCQAHGFLSLKRDEVCPMKEAQMVVAADLAAKATP